MTLPESINMYHKPQIFNFLALTLAAVAISFPIQIAYLYEYELLKGDHLVAIWHKLSMNNLMTMAILGVTAWKVSQVDQHLTPWLLASSAMVALNNFIVSAYASDWSVLQTNMATSLFIIAIGAFVFTKAYELTLAPHLHWWKPAKRHRIDAPVVIEFLGHHRFQAKLFDLSTSGAFVTGMQQQMLATLAPVNEEIAIKIPYKNEFYGFRCKLVRKCDSRGHYPSGWGLTFTDLSMWQRMRLMWMVNSSQKEFTF